MPAFIAQASSNSAYRFIGGIYLWLDLCLNWYEQAICLKIIRLTGAFDSTNSFKIFSISCCAVLNSINCLFLSYSASYLTIDTLFKHFTSKKRHIEASNIHFLSEFDYLMNLADSDHLFYCSHDLKYTKSLFNKLRSSSAHVGANSLVLSRITIKNFDMKNILYKLRRLVRVQAVDYSKSVYDSRCHFRYSLRFLCTQMVFFCCSSYLSLIVTNLLMYIFAPVILSPLPDQTSLLDKMNVSLKCMTGFVYCQNLGINLFCKAFDLEFAPPANCDIDVYAWIWLTYLAGILVPYGVFVFQFVQNFRAYKSDLFEVFRGHSEWTKNAKKSISNTEIAV